MIKLFVKMGYLEYFNVLDFFMLNSSESETIAYRQLLNGDVLADNSDILTVVRTIACLLSLLTEICVSPCEEIFLYNKIFRNNSHYSAVIKTMLRQYVSSVGCCTTEMMDNLKKSYLNTFIDEEMKEVCGFDKAKKAYVLKQKSQDSNTFPHEYYMSKSSEIK